MAGEGVSSRLLACYSARTDPAAYARTDPTAHEPSPTLHAAPWPPSASEFQAPAPPNRPSGGSRSHSPERFRHRVLGSTPKSRCPAPRLSVASRFAIAGSVLYVKTPDFDGAVGGAATGSCLSVEFGVPFGLGSFPPTPTRHWRNPRRLAYAAQQIGALQRRHLRSAGRRAHRRFLSSTEERQ